MMYGRTLELVLITHFIYTRLQLADGKGAGYRIVIARATRLSRSRME